MRISDGSSDVCSSDLGVMLGVLARLHYLTGKAAYRERAETLASAFSGKLTRNFFPLATLLNAAEMLLSAQQAVIVGARGAADRKSVVSGKSVSVSVDLGGCRIIKKKTKKKKHK